MKLNIKYTSIPPSSAIETYVIEKMSELDKFIHAGPGKGAAIEAWIEVGRTTEHHKKGDVFRAEVQIKLPGKVSVRAESVQSDLHLAIDEAKEEAERQLTRHKNKQLDKKLRGAKIA